jgi:hypothetical protein
MHLRVIPSAAVEMTPRMPHCIDTVYKRVARERTVLDFLLFVKTPLNPILSWTRVTRQVLTFSIPCFTIDLMSHWFY